MVNGYLYINHCLHISTNKVRNSVWLVVINSYAIFIIIQYSSLRICVNWFKYDDDCCRCRLNNENLDNRLLNDIHVIWIQFEILQSTCKSLAATDRVELRLIIDRSVQATIKAASFAVDPHVTMLHTRSWIQKPVTCFTSTFWQYQFQSLVGCQ